MHLNKPILSTITILLSLGLSSCKNYDSKNKPALKLLYKIYKDGKISECKLNSQTVYLAELNAYTTPVILYDKNGKKIADCDVSSVNLDPICGQVKDGEVIYRGGNDIWGEPAVDKYGLGK